MLKFFSNNFRKAKAPSLAIDLGTRNLLISNQQRVIFRQQTIAAQFINQKNLSNPVILGQKAEEISERNPGHYRIIQPIQKGVVCDFEHSMQIVDYALRFCTPRGFRKPEILLTVPLDVTDIERSAFKDILYNLDYPRVELIYEPTAAAVGLVNDFVNKKGVLLIDVGAGITESVVFSMGGLVCNSSIRIGGDDFESEIINHTRKRYHFEIGSRSAQKLLTLISEDHPDSYLRPIELKGMDTQHIIPSKIEFEFIDIHSSLDWLFQKIVHSVLQLLEKTPEELSGEIIEQGIFLTGGASQYKKLIQMLEAATNLNVMPDRQALLGVARGEISLLQNSELRKKILSI